MSNYKKGTIKEKLNFNSGLPGSRSSGRKRTKNKKAKVYTLRNDHLFVINDIGLNIPPTNIHISKEDVYWNWKTLRSSSSTKVPSGQGFCQVVVNMIFTPELLLHLHRLIVEIKNSPFIFVQNNFIKDNIDPSLLGPDSGDHVAQHMAFVVTSFHVNDASGLPGTFVARMDMKWFNYKPYTPNYLFKKDFLSLPIKGGGGKYYQKTIPVITGPNLKMGQPSLVIKDFKKHYKNTDYLRSNNFQDQLNKSSSNITLENSLNNFSGVIMDGMPLPPHIMPSLAVTPQHSNIYKRYINHLQFKSLYINFNIDVFKLYHPSWDEEKESGNELNDSFLKFTVGLPTTSTGSDFEWRETQSFHLESNSLIEGILENMHSHHAAFDLNYNEYIRVNFPPFIERCTRKIKFDSLASKIETMDLQGGGFGFAGRDALGLENLTKQGNMNGVGGKAYIYNKDRRSEVSLGSMNRPKKERYSFTGLGKEIPSLDDYQKNPARLHPPVGFVDLGSTSVRPIINSGYGIRATHPVTRKKNVPHKGVDINAPGAGLMKGKDKYKLARGVKQHNILVSELMNIFEGKPAPHVDPRYIDKLKALKVSFKDFLSKVEKHKKKKGKKASLNSPWETFFSTGGKGRGIIPIFAVDDGVVTRRGYDSGYGWRIEIESVGTSGSNHLFRHHYGHLSYVIDKTKKDTVKKGEIIGFMGNTGGSTGPHLHFEIKVSIEGSSWKFVPPYPFLAYVHSEEVVASSSRKASAKPKPSKAYNPADFEFKKNVKYESLSEAENEVFNHFLLSYNAVINSGFQPYLKGGSPGKILFKSQNLPLTNINSMIYETEDKEMSEALFLAIDSVRENPSLINYESIKKNIYEKKGTIKANQETLVTSCSASFSNIVASIPIVGHQYPTTQQMGQMEPSFNFEIQSFNNGDADLSNMTLPMKHLTSILNRLQYQARSFREAPDSHAFQLNTFLTRLMGSYRWDDMRASFDKDGKLDISKVELIPRMVANRSQVSNVEGFPGRYLMNLEVTETNPFQVEGLKAVKERKEVVQEGMEHKEILRKLFRAKDMEAPGKVAVLLSHLDQRAGAKWDPTAREIEYEYIDSSGDSGNDTWSVGSAVDGMPKVETAGFFFDTSTTTDAINAGEYLTNVEVYLRNTLGYGNVANALNMSSGKKNQSSDLVETLEEYGIETVEVEKNKVFISQENIEKFYNEYPWYSREKGLTGEDTISEILDMHKALMLICQKVRFTIAEEAGGGVLKEYVEQELFETNYWAEVYWKGGDKTKNYCSPHMWRNFIFYVYKLLLTKVIGDGTADWIDGALGWDQIDLHAYMNSIDWGLLYEDEANKRHKEIEKKMEEEIEAEAAIKDPSFRFFLLPAYAGHKNYKRWEKEDWYSKGFEQQTAFFETELPYMNTELNDDEDIFLFTGDGSRKTYTYEAEEYKLKSVKSEIDDSITYHAHSETGEYVGKSPYEIAKHEAGINDSHGNMGVHMELLAGSFSERERELVEQWAEWQIGYQSDQAVYDEEEETRDVRAEARKDGPYYMKGFYTDNSGAVTYEDTYTGPYMYYQKEKDADPRLTSVPVSTVDPFEFVFFDLYNKGSVDKWHFDVEGTTGPIIDFESFYNVATLDVSNLNYNVFLVPLLPRSLEWMIHYQEGTYKHLKGEIFEDDTNAKNMETYKFEAWHGENAEKYGLVVSNTEIIDKLVSKCIPEDFKIVQWSGSKADALDMIDIMIFAVGERTFWHASCLFLIQDGYEGNIMEPDGDPKDEMLRKCYVDVMVRHVIFEDFHQTASGEYRASGYAVNQSGDLTGKSLPRFTAEDIGIEDYVTANDDEGYLEIDPDLFITDKGRDLKSYLKKTFNETSLSSSPDSPWFNFARIAIKTIKRKWADEFKSEVSSVVEKILMDKEPIGHKKEKAIDKPRIDQADIDKVIDFYQDDILYRDKADIVNFISDLPSLDLNGFWAGVNNTGANWAAGFASLFGMGGSGGSTGSSLSELDVIGHKFKYQRQAITDNYFSWLNTKNLVTVLGKDTLDYKLMLLKAYTEMRFTEDEIKKSEQRRKFEMFNDLTKRAEGFMEWYLEPRLINNIGLDILLGKTNWSNMGGAKRVMSRSAAGFMYWNTDPSGNAESSLGIKATTTTLAGAEAYGAWSLVKTTGRTVLKVGGVVVGVLQVGLPAAATTTSLFYQKYYKLEGIVELEDENDISAGFESTSKNKLDITSRYFSKSNSATWDYYHQKANSEDMAYDLDKDGSISSFEERAARYGTIESETKSPLLFGSDYEEHKFILENQDMRVDASIIKHAQLRKYTKRDKDKAKVQAFRNELDSLVKEVLKNREVCIALKIPFLESGYNYIPSSERYSGQECYPDLDLPNHPFYDSSNFEIDPAFYMWDIYTDGGIKLTKEYLEGIAENAKIYLDGAYSHLKKLEDSSIIAIPMTAEAESVANSNSNRLSMYPEATDNVKLPSDIVVDTASGFHKVIWKNIGECQHPFFTGQAKRSQLSDEHKKELITMLNESAGRASYKFSFAGKKSFGSIKCETKQQVQEQRVALYKYLRFMEADGNKVIRKGKLHKVADGFSAFPGSFSDTVSGIGAWAVGVDISNFQGGSMTDRVLGFDEIHVSPGLEKLKPIVKNNSFDSNLYYANENPNIFNENMALEAKVSSIEGMFGNGAGYVGDIIEEKTGNSKEIENLLNDVKLRGMGSQADYNQTFSLTGLADLAKASSARIFTEKMKMSRAYPTFKLFFVEEDEFESRFLNLDDFYSFNGVRSFTVNRSRERAADTAVISLQNIAGTLDGTRKGVAIDVDYFSKKRIERAKKLKARSKSGTVYEADNNEADIEKDQPFSAVVLRPGMNIQLRAGYSNNPDNLEVLISGRITDITWGGSGDTCEIVVQSFGTELVQQIKGLETDSDKNEFYATHQVLGSMMLSPELKHFGRWETGRIFQYGEAQDNRLDFFKYKENAAPNFLDNISRYASFVADNALAAAVVTASTAIVALLGRRAGIMGGGFPGAGLNVVSKGLKGGKGVAIVAKSNKSIVWGNIKTFSSMLVSSRLLPSFTWATKYLGRSKGFTYNTAAGYTAIRRALLNFDPKAMDVFGNLTKGGRQFALSLNNNLLRFTSNLVKQTAAASKLLKEASKSGGKTVALTKGKAKEALKYVDEALDFTPSKLGKGHSSKMLTSLRSDIKLLREAIGPSELSRLTSAQSAQLVNVLQKAEMLAVVMVSPANFGARAIMLQGFSKAGLWANAKYFGTGAIGSFFSYIGIFIKTSMIYWLADLMVGPIVDSYREYRTAYKNWFTKELVYFKLNPADDNLYPPSPVYYMHNLTNIEENWMKKIGVIWSYAWSDISGERGASINSFLEKWQQTNPILYLKRVHPTDCKYRLNRSTIWDIFHEMSLRHPGWIYSAVPYGKEFRYTMFFGIPSQRYWAKPATKSFIQRMNLVRNMLTSNINNRKLYDRLRSRAYGIGPTEGTKGKTGEYDIYKKAVMTKLEKGLNVYAEQLVDMVEGFGADEDSMLDLTQRLMASWYDGDRESFDYQFTTVFGETDIGRDKVDWTKDRYFTLEEGAPAYSHVFKNFIEMIKKSKSKYTTYRDIKREAYEYAKSWSSYTSRIRVNTRSSQYLDPEVEAELNIIQRVTSNLVSLLEGRKKKKDALKAINDILEEHRKDTLEDRFIMSEDKYYLNVGVAKFRTRLMKEYLTGLENRFIPFRNYHLIRSNENLIKNNLTASSKNVVNSVNVYYKDSVDKNTTKSIFMKASSGIGDENLITGSVNRYEENVRSRPMATRYGIGSLIYGMKNMYGGEVMILGDPAIKPWDICFLFDHYNKMKGPFEVKSVTHIFSFETGFITEIVPNAIVVGNETSSWPVLEALKVYVGGALSRYQGTRHYQNLSKDEIQDGFDFTGPLLPKDVFTPKSKEDDKAFKALKGNLMRMNKQTSKELGGIAYGTHLQNTGVSPFNPNIDMEFNGYNLSYEASESLVDRYSEMVRDGLIKYQETDVGERAEVDLSVMLGEVKNADLELFPELQDVEDEVLGYAESLMQFGVKGYFALEAMDPLSGSKGEVTGKTAGLTSIGIGLLSLLNFRKAGVFLSTVGFGTYTMFASKQYAYKRDVVLDRFSASYLIASPVIFSKLLETEAVTVVPMIKEESPLLAGISTRSPTALWKNILGDIVSAGNDAFGGMFDTIEENKAMGTAFYKHVVSRNPERRNDRGMKYLRESGKLNSVLKGN